MKLEEKEREMVVKKDTELQKDSRQSEINYCLHTNIKEKVDMIFLYSLLQPVSLYTFKNAFEGKCIIVFWEGKRETEFDGENNLECIMGIVEAKKNFLFV